ncbi:MAG: ribonuclease III [Clostridia bacterium]
MKRDELAAFEARIGHQFHDRALLSTALTHPSYGGEHHAPNYQRLEFLGDAVLELCVSELLYKGYPAYDEGQLTRLRASLVREETLGDVARDWEVGRYIRLSVGEGKAGGADKPSILSDVCEATLAAVYLDGGFDAARALVARMMDGRLPDPDPERDNTLDAKSRLQEALQRMGKPSPEYALVEQDGPAHLPVFTECVYVDGSEAGRGSGQNKRAAQQAAAQAALLHLFLDSDT